MREASDFSWGHGFVRKTLWTVADQLRANSTPAPAEYREPVLGLIGRPVIMLVDGRDVRVIDDNGELLKHLKIDRSRNYQGRDLECPR